MAPVAKGFALHSGTIPPKSGIAVLLESPGPDEPVFLVKYLVDGPVEIDRRKQWYPELEDRWTKVGAPVVGRAGTLMWNWIMQPMGLQRTDVAVFNTLHCYPGKDASGAFAYPKGVARKKSEGTCAGLWLRQLVEWNPTVSVVAMHPSAISRDVVPLPMVLRAVERAKTFAAKGERVLLLMGGKAAKHWIGYGENTTRWCGHWQRETEWTRARRAERWEKGRGMSMVKERKPKKLTVKAALQLLLSKGKFLDTPGISRDYTFDFMICESDYDEMLALCAPKPKIQSKVLEQTETATVSS